MNISSVFQDSEAGKSVVEVNARYDSLLNVKIGNDSYVAASVQTMDNGAKLHKQKYAQTSTADYTESGAQWQPQADAEVIAEAGAAEANSAATSEMLRGATAKV